MLLYQLNMVERLLLDRIVNEDCVKLGNDLAYVRWYSCLCHSTALPYMEIAA